MLGTALIVSAGVGHSAQVTLAWDANRESNLAGYKIYFGTAPREYSWVLDVGKVTTYTVTGLTDGLAYYFSATAYDTANQESDFSREVSTSTCTYSLSPASQSFAASAGTGTVEVTTQSRCPWTAGRSPSWMTVTSGGNGIGDGTVRYSLSANTGSSPRSANATVAGKVFTVTQAGASESAFTITASAGTGGSISPSGALSVSSGTGKTFAITPNAGYRVADVLVDGASVGAVATYSFSSVSANHTIAASFAANPTSFTLTASAGTGGSISPSGPVSVSKGTSKTFTVTPHTGYRLTGLLVDGSSATPVTTYSATIVTADTGYRVTGLVVDDLSATPVSTYTFNHVTANHTIAASFAPHISTGPKTITASAGTGGSISPSGTVSVGYGAGRTFTIKSNTGYRVSRVLVDGASVGAVTAYTFSNVAANHTIAVTFSRLRGRSAAF